MVHTHYKHGGISRSRDNDSLGSTLQLSPSLLQSDGDSTGLLNILSNSITPFDIGKFSLCEDIDGFSIDDTFPIFILDYDMEFAVGAITLEYVEHVVEVNEGWLMTKISTLSELKSASPTDQVLNLAKFVYSNLHYCVSGMQLVFHQKI